MGRGGGGKIPLNPNYVIDSQPGRVTLRNFEGQVFEYPDPTPMPQEAYERLHARVD